MPRPRQTDETAALRLAGALLGLILLASAALAAGLAAEHMAALGAICGAAPQAHCGWCLAAVGFALAGVTALVAALRPRPRARRA